MLTESPEIINRLFPISLYFTVLFFFSKSSSIFFLVLLCRAIFLLMFSILFLPIASNIKLHYLFHLPCDSSRFPSPTEFLSDYKQPLRSFINPISSAFCNCHLIKTGVPRGFQRPLTHQSYKAFLIALSSGHLVCFENLTFIAFFLTDLS